LSCLNTILMLNNKTIAVVVPAYNEERQIAMVISTMPAFVDRIVVVSDASKDATTQIVSGMLGGAHDHSEVSLKSNLTAEPEGPYARARKIMQQLNRIEQRYFTEADMQVSDPESSRIVLITHRKNKGVGAAIASGYKWCKDHDVDCTAVMAGDGQMDPDELESICRPVVDEGIDYVKGNRLIHLSSWQAMPRARFLGNSLLSILTKIASGYWNVSDTQSGYTAISRKALNAITLFRIYKRYGMPNDMLVKLNIAFCTLKEVEIKPVYEVGEKSKMKISRVILPIAWLLFKSFFKRLWQKYLFRDFHPLFLLYHFAMILGIVSIPYGIKILKLTFSGNNVSPVTLVVFVFLVISSLQSLMFAMWMDIQDNARLYKN
jgi:glycosyltransferase involved in cell wall biosynthesis